MNPIKKPEVKYTQLFINNEFVNSKSGKTFASINPTTLEEIAQVQEALAEDVDLAVKAAEAAFDRDSQWRTMEASARGELLYKLATLMQRDRDYLASLETYNNGKPIKDSYGDVDDSIGTLKFYASRFNKDGCHIINAGCQLFTYTNYEPIGVYGAIITFKHPILMAIVKISQSLATGSTLVLKPAEQTPLTALAIAALMKEAGFPKGVINIVPGFEPTTEQPLVEHPAVSKITFTGSIQSLLACKLKRVSLERGGNRPLIILPDSEIDKAAEIAHATVMVNHRQCCVPTATTYVHVNIYEKFVGRLVELANARKVGDINPAVNQGSKMELEQFTKILDLTESAKFECGGNKIGDKGFVEPTVFSNATDDMRNAEGEIFGPVHQIMKFTTISRLIRGGNIRSNGSDAEVYSRDSYAAREISSKLRAGTVNINNYCDPSRYDSTASINQAF